MKWQEVMGSADNNNLTMLHRLQILMKGKPTLGEKRRGTARKGLPPEREKEGFITVR